MTDRYINIHSDMDFKKNGDKTVYEDLTGPVYEKIIALIKYNLHEPFRLITGDENQVIIRECIVDGVDPNTQYTPIEVSPFVDTPITLGYVPKLTGSVSIYFDSKKAITYDPKEDGIVETLLSAINENPQVVEGATSNCFDAYECDSTLYSQLQRIQNSNPPRSVKDFLPIPNNPRMITIQHGVELEPNDSKKSVPGDNYNSEEFVAFVYEGPGSGLVRMITKTDGGSTFLSRECIIENLIDPKPILIENVGAVLLFNERPVVFVNDDTVKTMRPDNYFLSTLMSAIDQNPDYSKHSYSTCDTVYGCSNEVFRNLNEGEYKGSGAPTIKQPAKSGSLPVNAIK